MNKNSIIYDDLYRYTGNRSFKSLIRYVLFTPAFRYIFFFRKCQKKNLLFPFYRVMLFHYSHKYGIQIPYQTKIGRGLRILHFNNIVINPEAIIGENFNITQGCTIGIDGGDNFGVPKIGNNVAMQPNSVVVGNITIGDNSLIAPNAFVNFDVPPDSIVITQKCKVIYKENASVDWAIRRV
ncbi:serine O-acetyltransferase [Emticicia fluvialis]|uniref:serine O-acetyltransferase n=1 Tax=Emticicia fluvialis TaxID=2974474 RepID=UPI002165D836|nr:serine acetyltransferase [Emticicia fluvialis]